MLEHRRRPDRERLRVADLFRAGTSAALILGIMLVGGVVLWVGVPVGWLWIGSQVQGSTHSIGTALGVAMVGAIASIMAIASLLGWLNRKHLELVEARGIKARGTSILEYILAITAGIAVLGFTVWFVLFAGPGPSIAPTN